MTDTLESLRAQLSEAIAALDGVRLFSITDTRNLCDAAQAFLDAAVVGRKT